MYINKIIKIVLEGRDRLVREQRKLSTEILDDAKNMLLAKEAAVKLANLLHNYETLMKKQHMGRFKLADEIILKKRNKFF